ncbi:unnamed protein product [Ophioblennius macclurei]
MPNLKLISATDTQYAATVLKSMNDQRNHGLFCDVTIIIQDKKFRAHKTILSASSTYFHQIFSVSGQVIEMNFIKPEIFELILNYIYSSKLFRVRSDMLEELINAGQILGVKFIANLGTPLTQVKGLPGLSKETDGKGDDSTETMPIITESFSISAEEFNQTTKPNDDDNDDNSNNNNDEDSDSDVMFVSHTNSQTRAADQKPVEIINLDKDTEDVPPKPSADSNSEAVKSEEGNPAPVTPSSVKTPSVSSTNVNLASSSPLRSPDSSSNNNNATSSPARVSSCSAPTTPARPSAFTPEPSSASQSSENNDLMGVHKKQVSTTSQEGDFKITLTDVCASSTSALSNIPKPAVTAKKTVTLDTATEIDSISSGCKVYANIGEDTYDIVPVKEDPGEGGSKVNKGKRAMMATPLKPFDKNLVAVKGAPSKKKTKSELEDHYELIMDGKTFYVCIVCKRPYVCLTSLRRHFNTHSWEKKYPCRYCNKVFALAEYRTKHEISHTGERRYQCLLCSETFLNYQLLSTHCKQIHNQDPSGRKSKEDKDNNLYRLLPCKTLQMKSYSWTTEGLGVPVISEDGSLHHMPPMGGGGGGGGIVNNNNSAAAAAQNRMLSWDEAFVDPNAHMPPGPHVPPGSNMHHPPQRAEFDFDIPETY